MQFSSKINQLKTQIIEMVVLLAKVELHRHVPARQAEQAQAPPCLRAASRGASA